ncbi:trans-acting enoyl reductase family protein [Synechococcus sp. PCC 7336]|uniref:saccharopine dehydrogenase family protein n=1 Tax=Synechococcus sp. PCC 7336 TaxID=195250 RepID=UPI00037130C7|nr:saccharopine dehydrogenase NADP-binding domain-containing protein [Synechococcus sp. PCC 7336]
MADVLIYGATGYMGKLCAREMVKQGLRPILAGRRDTVRAVAQELGCPASVFNLEDESEIERQLSGVTLAVNLAGPFQRTQKPLIAACLAARCHYIDIAGEVDEMRSAFTFGPEAKRAGIMLMPGAGFGVVPTDIAAYMAKELLPKASKLTILYATEGGASRGTLKTVLKNINQPGVRKVNGEWVIAHPAESSMDFEVAGKTFTGVYNPWRADLFTAGLSTGIDNIQTYTVFPGFIVQMMRGRLLWLRNLILNQLLGFLPEGPSERQLQQGSTYVMAIAANETESRSVSLRGPEAYLFTAFCLREIATKILNGNFAAGFQTPSYFGRALLDSLGTIQWD